MTCHFFLRDSKEVLKSRIQRFHDQLTKGCGQESCDNPDCATGSKNPLKATEAAVKAVKLAKQGKAAWLCVGLNCISSSGEDMRVSGKNSFTSTGSVSSGSLKSADAEPMDTTDSTGETSSLGVEPSSSADSAASSTLILVTSHMDTTGESSRSKTSALSGTSGTKSAAVLSGKGKVPGRKELPPIGMSVALCQLAQGSHQLISSARCSDSLLDGREGRGANEQEGWVWRLQGADQ